MKNKIILLEGVKMKTFLGHNYFSVFVILAIVTICGCATIMHGTTQQVSIASNPSGGSVTINGINLGNTPLIADLKRKDNHLVKIELKNYSPYEMNITHNVSGWVWGNVLFGGLIGLVVDAVSGGIYKLTPEQVQAELRNSGNTFFYKKDSLYIITTLTHSDDWEKIGELNKN
jgi:hypothetical protein